ncbi:MAG: hypothetical protein ABIN61_09135 [candidate division WOR-3 bacterium]
MKFLRIIIVYIGIVILCFLYVLFMYPFNWVFGTEKASLKKYIRYLKVVIFEGKPISDPFKQWNFFKDGAARLKYNSYSTKWANTLEYDSPLLCVTSTNYENIIKTANIPESVKEEIKKIVENGDGVLISEAAFKPGWKYPEKYVVIESFDKKPPKVKYMCSIFRGFPGMNFIQRSRFNAYYMKYKSTKKPLLYPLVWVSKDNKEELLPELDIPKQIKKDIEKLVNKNKIVIITEAAFQPEWKWDEKYLVFDRKKS